MRISPSILKLHKVKNKYSLPDPWKQQRFRKVGWLCEVHPKLTWSQDLKLRIQKSLEKIDTPARLISLWKSQLPLGDPRKNKEIKKVPVPFFQLQTENRAFGNGISRQKITCICILTNTTESLFLKGLLCEAYNNQPLPGRFVPIGIQNSLSPKHYKQSLANHAEFLSTVTQIPILGLTEGSLDTSRITADGKKLTLQEYILHSTY